jgi:hypothetical protein
MFNWRVSFTACHFSEQELQEWLAWCSRNINMADLTFTKEEEHASDAKDLDGATERQRTKRVGR